VADALCYWPTSIDSTPSADGECGVWVEAPFLGDHLLLVTNRAIGTEAACARIAAPGRMRPISKLAMGIKAMWK
jgi:hypothetical protein